MAGFDPYAQYRTVKYSTSDQGSLILKSYDGAIRFCRAGKECLESDDSIGKGKWLSKAFDVVGELRKSLRPDAGGEVAGKLDEAYAFLSRQITLANVLSEPSHIDNALLLLENLRDAWREVVQMERTKSALPV